MGTISLKEVVAGIDSGQPFDIGYYTCDLGRGKGGDLVVLTKVVKAGKQKEEAKSESAFPAEKKKSKNPNHWQNSTRNIYNPKGEKRKKVVKVHLRLITMFNGKEVL